MPAPTDPDPAGSDRTPENTRPAPTGLPSHPADPSAKAPELCRRAQAGDSAARRELREATLEYLKTHFGRIAHHLSCHACLSEGDPARFPTTSHALMKHLADGVERAISAWKREGNWIEFAAIQAVTAMWNAAASLFKAAAREIVRETIIKLDAPKSHRTALLGQLPVVVAAICADAPEMWLLRSLTPPNWPAFVPSRATHQVGMLLSVRMPAGDSWELNETLKGRITSLAKKFTLSSYGYVYEPLFEELLNDALYRVWRAERFNETGVPRTEAFLMTVAKHAMFAILGVNRSRNLTGMWLMIRGAILAIRERKLREGRPGEDPEPTVDEIARELDPNYARGEKDKPKFSHRRIREVMAMFAFDPEQAGVGPASNDALPMLEDLMSRARLTEEEKKVVELRLEEVSHKDIAAKLKITPQRSIKVHHNAMKKIGAVAKRLTDEEWTVLNLKTAGGKSHREIADHLGIPERDTHVLFHSAREQLAKFPELHVKLTGPEWKALDLALSGMTHQGIASEMKIQRDEVAVLLTSGIGKLPRPGTAKKPRKKKS